MENTPVATKTSRARRLTIGGIVGALASLATIVGVLISIGAIPNFFVPPPKPTPTPTPPTAAEIVDKAESAPFKDISGTISGSLTFEGTSFTVTGAITITSNPDRSDTMETLRSGSTVVTAYSIFDGDVEYDTTTQSDNPPREAPPDSVWMKSSSASVGTHFPTLVVFYQKVLTNPVLVDSEDVNGVPTYHLRSTHSQEDDDVWVRRDNFYADKIKRVSDKYFLEFDFNLWDKGARISVPSAGQIATPTP